jgi:hypothetical protein
MLSPRISKSIIRRALLAVPCSLFPVLLLLGCKSTPTPAPHTEATPAPSITYPARPTTPPASFKLFHHYDSSFTLTTPDKATDDQLAALVWQLRDAARTHTFDKLHIPQKDVDAGGANVWFHIYRGTKCAGEKYTDGKLPCGNSYHASADYTYSLINSKPWDKGVLLHDEKETPLWNPDAPYIPTHP